MDYQAVIHTRPHNKQLNHQIHAHDEHELRSILYSARLLAADVDGGWNSLHMAEQFRSTQYKNVNATKFVQARNTLLAIVKSQNPHGE